MLEKVFRLRPFYDIYLICLLPSYINFFNNTFNQVYSPRLDWFIGSLSWMLLLLVAFLFSEKITLSEQGIESRFNGWQRKNFTWQDVAYISGLDETTNKRVKELKFFDHSNQLLDKYNIYSIGNYSAFIRLVREKVKDDRTADILLQNEQQQQILTKWATRLNIVLLASLLLLIGLKLQINFVHIAFGYESTIYYGYGTFFWLCLAILTIITIINRKKPFMSEYFQLALLSIFLLIVTIKVLTTSLSLYHENLIKNNKLPTTTLNTQLSGRPNSQYWEILTNNKPAVKFDLKDWQGMNQKLISPDFDVNYDKKPSYQLQAYQGKFGYYVITPEQFANAQPIK